MKNNFEEFIKEQIGIITDVERKAYQAGYKAGYKAKEKELKDKKDKMVEDMYQDAKLKDPTI